MPAGKLLVNIVNMNRKSALLQLARDIYLSEGRDHLTMRRLAERAGISAPAIYRHFKNKEELFHAILEQGVRMMSETVHACPALGENPAPDEILQRIRLLPETLLLFSRKHPEYYDALFMVPRTMPEGMIEPPLFIRRHLEPLRRSILEALEAGIRTGLFIEMNPLETTVSLLGTCHGLIALARLGIPVFNAVDFDKLYRTSVDRFITGISRCPA